MTAFPVGRRCVVTANNNKKLKPWRALIAGAAKTEGARRGIVFVGATTVHAIFLMPRPKTVKRELHTVKPDGDKLLRAFLDGITEGGLIKDDALVVKATFEKQYAEADGPGVIAVIEGEVSEM